MEISRIAEQFSHGIGGPIALALIAFSTVFIVLMALTFTIIAIRYLAAFSERKPTKPAGPEQKSTPTPTPPVSAAPSGTDKNVVAAVIAAALAVSGGGKALSVRPLEVAGRGKSTAWKMAGRMDLLEGFE